MGVPKKQLDAAIAYIRETPEIRDCLISGGDGLLINDQILEYILKELRSIPHLEVIRIGTRAPVVFPQRKPDRMIFFQYLAQMIGNALRKDDGRSCSDSDDFQMRNAAQLF